MIKIENKAECCGCTACMSICPKNAIEMIEDEEGFLYPVVNEEKCINCRLCEERCPVLNSKKNKKEQDGYVLNNKQNDIRKDSTSGGAFTPIAEYTLKQKGVVYGAMFDENFNVVHGYIEDKKDLTKLRGSKYVQSFLDKSFKDIKSFLENGRYVCFSGTPCQVEGLKKFLNKEYKNLITVDVMCHAVPSPLVWRKYFEYIKKNKLNNEDVEKVLFRDKSKYGFKYSTMTLKSKSKEYYKGVETDPFLRAFFGDLSDRPSCYNCVFKKQEHESDFTIWDCFIAENFDKTLDDDAGTSRMLINTEKGKEIFENIKDNFYYTKVNVGDLTKDVKEMLCSVNLPEGRKEFFEDIKNMESKKFFEKYFKDTLKVKIERNVRILLIKSGLYKQIKKIAKKVLRK